MDKEFAINSDGLHQSVELMSRDFSNAEGLDLPLELPQFGVGSTGALNSLAPSILGGAARLGEATSFAHMNPVARMCHLAKRVTHRLLTLVISHRNTLQRPNGWQPTQNIPPAGFAAD